MPIKLRPTFITMLMALLTMAVSSLTSANAQSSIDKLDRTQFHKFHLSLIEVQLIQERRTFYPKKASQNKFKSVSTGLELIQNLLFSSAQAQLSTDFCFFGGWPSFVEDGVCKTPWTYAGHGDLIEIGESYSPEYQCENPSDFRCNPTMFGPGESGLGNCIQIDGYDDVTKQCFAKSKELPEDVYERFRTDPEFHRKYLRLAYLSVEFCSQAPDYSACQELMASLKSTTNFVCNDQFLNDIVGSDKFLELASNWSDLEQRIIKNPGIARRLGERVEKEVTVGRELKAPLTNDEAEKISVSGDFADYSNSQETKNFVEKLQKRTKVCDPTESMKSRGFSKCTPGGYKAPGSSIGACLRYVKKGITGTLEPQTPGGVHAVNFGSGLRGIGFVNLMSSSEYSGLTSSDPRIPPGAILIYENTSASGPESGHIEVKTYDNTFVSDYESSNPRDVRYDKKTGKRINSYRKLVGVYVKP